MKIPANITDREPVPLMTKANGIAVKIKERPKPVRYEVTVPLLAPVVLTGVWLIYITPIMYTMLNMPIHTISRKCQNMLRRISRDWTGVVRPLTAT